MNIYERLKELIKINPYQAIEAMDEVTPAGNCKRCGYPVGTCKTTKRIVHYDVHDSANNLYIINSDHGAVL